MDILNYILDLRIDYNLFDSKLIEDAIFNTGFVFAFLSYWIYQLMENKEVEKIKNNIQKICGDENFIALYGADTFMKIALYCAPGFCFGAYIFPSLIFKNLIENFVGKIDFCYFIFFGLCFVALLYSGTITIKCMYILTDETFFTYNIEKERFYTPRKYYAKRNEIKSIKFKKAIKEKASFAFTNTMLYLENINCLHHIENYKEIIKERFNVEE